MATYLIIGGSSGIGQSLVAQLQGAGHNILATYRQTQVNDEGAGVSYHYADVNKDFSLDFLPDTLDGLAYCPGSIHLKPFHRLSPESFLEDYNIAPSLTDTPLASKLLNSESKREANAERHPLKRVGQAEDMASMAHFLLSDKSSWITGQVFPVDGGLSSIRS